MPNLKVTLYIRIVTPEGKRKMCKPVYASRGRLKPLHAQGFGHQPDGEYYLRYAGKWEAVGNDRLSWIAISDLDATGKEPLRQLSDLPPLIHEGKVSGGFANSKLRLVDEEVEVFEALHARHVPGFGNRDRQVATPHRPRCRASTGSSDSEGQSLVRFA